MVKNTILFILALFLTTNDCSAQSLESSLKDQNGDGSVNILSFGDSITRGIGDESLQGGYPARVAALLSIPVDNEGLAGERLTVDGWLRFATAVRRSNADLVTILEGSNDAIQAVSVRVYKDTLQKMINASRILGKEPVLMTLPKPCCDHAGLGLFTDSYTDEIFASALANDLKVIDIRKAWETTCINKEDCELYNLPEGLHPTSKGYTVMAQTIAATLLGIDIFASDGAAQLEAALGLTAGSVIVKPAVTSNPAV